MNDARCVTGRGVSSGGVRCSWLIRATLLAIVRRRVSPAAPSPLHLLLFARAFLQPLHYLIIPVPNYFLALFAYLRAILLHATERANAAKISFDLFHGRRSRRFSANVWRTLIVLFRC
jgi:hypothetical protein